MSKNTYFHKGHETLDLRLVKTQAKKNQSFKPINYSFIESLSVSVENEQLRDPESSVYLKKFRNKNIKTELMHKIYKRLNQEAFENKLPKDLKLELSSRLTSTGGYCKNFLKLDIPICEIQLSSKICDSPERMRDVLAHEMCHAASFLINGVLNGHGPTWKSWANRVNFIYRQIPKITVYHNYEIKKKYIFKCQQCSLEYVDLFSF